MTGPGLITAGGRLSIARSLWGNRYDATDLTLKLTYLILQVLDLGLTLLAIALGGTELNPVMRASLSSPVQLAVMKVGLPLMLAWLLPGRFLIPAIAFLLLVLVWNIKELLLVFC